jgi:hypothetical protein
LISEEQAEEKGLNLCKNWDQQTPWFSVISSGLYRSVISELRRVNPVNDLLNCRGERQMRLTKPAGVAFQVIGFALAIGALVRLFNGFSLTAIVLLVLGGWMAWEGGKTARQPRKKG